MKTKLARLVLLRPVLAALVAVLAVTLSSCGTTAVYSNGEHQSVVEADVPMQGWKVATPRRGDSAGMKTYAAFVGALQTAFIPPLTAGAILGSAFAAP